METPDTASQIRADRMRAGRPFLIGLAASTILIALTGMWPVALAPASAFALLLWYVLDKPQQAQRDADWADEDYIWQAIK